MKFKVEHLLIIALGLVIIYLSTCNSNPVETKTVTKTVTRVDSVRVIDTIKTIVSVPYASTPLIEYIYISDSLTTFVYSKKDSLLSYEISVDSECQPEDVRIKYDVNQFTILDSIYIRDSVHVKEVIRKSFMSIGGQVIGGKSFGFAPMITYQHKKGVNFGLGYDVFNQNVHVSFTKRISLNK